MGHCQMQCPVFFRKILKKYRKKLIESVEIDGYNKYKGYFVQKNVFT